MPDPARPPMKPTPEGLALIKSLEGFRPVAMRRGNRWVVGYGHTLSAREGARITEAEAELLLRYDLIPVVEAVNSAVTVRINPHQFDALVSFAHSIGVDDFKASDVLHRLNKGDGRAAADALAGWPEAPAPESLVRRRAAERAMFNTEADREASLVSLMTAPLPPVEEDGTVLPFPAADDDAHLFVDPEPEPDSEAATETPSPADAVASPQADPTTELAKPAPPAWRIALPLLIVGAVGFIGFGVAMGTLRLSSMPSARSGEIALSGWLLAVLSIGVIGYAGWRLYDRWGRGADTD